MRKKYMILPIIALILCFSLGTLTFADTKTESISVDISELIEKYSDEIIQPKSTAQEIIAAVWMDMRAPTEMGPWTIVDDWATYKFVYPPNGYHYEQTGGSNFYFGKVVEHLWGTYYSRLDHAVPIYELVVN